MHVAPSQQLGLAAWVAACAIALWRGRKPERLYAALMLLILFSTIAVQELESTRSVQWTLLVGDLALLAAAVLLLSRHIDRRWLVWATGIQIVSSLSHIPRMIDATIRIWGYITVVTMCGYGLLLALLWGALVESRSANARR